MHVAAYIEALQAERAAPTVKQHLACKHPINIGRFASATRFPTGISTSVEKVGGKGRRCRDRDSSLSRLIVSNLLKLTQAEGRL